MVAQELPLLRHLVEPSVHIVHRVEVLGVLVEDVYLVQFLLLPQARESEVEVFPVERNVVLCRAAYLPSERHGLL